MGDSLYWKKWKIIRYSYKKVDEQFKKIIIYLKVASSYLTNKN